MSTKIYNAFKIKDPANLWPLLWKIEDKAKGLIKAAIREHYIDLVRTFDVEDKDYIEARKKAGTVSEHGFRLATVRDKVRKAFKDNATSGHRDTYNLEVSVGIYPYRGQFYLRTFADSISIVGKCLDFVEKMPELEDFHYQNQSDRPDNVSAKDWRARRRIWDGIMKPNEIGRHVVLDLHSFSGFTFSDPWFELAQEWAKNPPKLPIYEEVWAENLRKVAELKDMKITFKPGMINGEDFAIYKTAGGWFSKIGNKAKKPFPTLNRAANYVWFEYQSEETKELVRGMIAQSKAPS